MGDNQIPNRPGISQPFFLYDGAVRGRLVRLNGVASKALGIHHNYPEQVTRILGEAMAAAAALADGLKFDGSFTLQIQGNGPLHTLVADITNDRVLRGCASFRLDELPDTEGVDDKNLQRLMGSGHIAFTVDQGPDMERYQGIIELLGTSIGDCVHQYFQQSEQIETAIKIVAGRVDTGDPDSAWQASALLIQRMPSEGGLPPTEADEDAWRTAVVLLSSISDAELLSSELTEKDVLARLFGTIGGRALDSRSLSSGCRCSRERSAKILASFPMDEIVSMAEDGVVSMTCEFCESVYEFKESELQDVARKAREEFSAPTAP